MISIELVLEIQSTLVLGKWISLHAIDSMDFEIHIFLLISIVLKYSNLLFNANYQWETKAGRNRPLTGSYFNGVFFHTILFNRCENCAKSTQWVQYLGMATFNERPDYINVIQNGFSLNLWYTINVRFCLAVSIFICLWELSLRIRGLLTGSFDNFMPICSLNDLPLFSVSLFN